MQASLDCSRVGRRRAFGISLRCRLRGGEGGIRTPDTLSGMPVFKTGAINHSATSPMNTVLLQFFGDANRVTEVEMPGSGTP